MNDLMLDIETMGTKSFRAIVTIAAVQFDRKTGAIGKEFYKVIDLQSCIDLQLKIDADTLYWWMKQPDEARKKIMEYKEPLPKVLSDLAIWFNSVFNSPNQVSVWGNSARFDLGMLENCYSLCRQNVPWNHWEEMDLRTITNLTQRNKDIKRGTKFEGIKHYAVDDCKHQIKYLTEMLNN